MEALRLSLSLSFLFFLFFYFYKSPTKKFSLFLSISLATRPKYLLVPSEILGLLFGNLPPSTALTGQV
jgi:hypothetical protein